MDVMTTSSVIGSVGTDLVPHAVRALGSMTDPDYADRFTLPTDAVATPEQWARAMFGNVPNRAEVLIWRGLLGLKLTRERSPATVAGWRITARGADWIRLEAASWFLTGNLLVQTSESRVSLTTFVRYDRNLGHVVWRPLSTLHRRLVPHVLSEAAKKIKAPG